MTGHRISWASAKDTAALVPLMQALYAHETPDALPQNDEATQDHLRALLAPGTPHRLAVIWSDNGVALGLAAVARLTSIADPRDTQRYQMELKELFVLKAHRGAGLGHHLMQWVETQARDQQAYRMDWHVKEDNRRGIAFYQGFGGAIVTNRLSMRKRLTPTKSDQASQ